MDLLEAPLSISQAAKRLDNISEWQLREMVKTGIIPATRLSGRYFVRPSDLKASKIGQHWRDFDMERSGT